MKLSARFRSAGLALTLVAIAAWPTATRAGEDVPRCHGLPATVVGTPGPDAFSSDADATGEGHDIDIDSHDVVVAGGGRDSVGIHGISDVRACGNGGRDQLSALDTSGSDAGRNLVFDGGAGADRLGDDTQSDFGPVWRPLKLFGGVGNDILLGGGKPDQMRGEGGKDEAFGGGGRDNILGGAGGDQLLAGSGADTMRGSSGADRLKGEGGQDKARGGAGGDHCEAEVKQGCET